LPHATAVEDARPENRCDSRSDQDLIEGILGRDEAAFNVVYGRYFHRVYNFSYARLRNRADAEEVTQETFIAVFRSMSAYRGRSSLLSWIYGIARNTINNQLRRSKAYDQRLERAETEITRSGDSLDHITPEESLSLRRCANAVERSLESVTDWQAEVFELRHFEDLPIQEIADRMCRSNDAIRSSLYRVKRLVVESVDQETTHAD